MVSSFTDYTVGIYLGRAGETTKRKMLLAISLFVNLGILFVFKYFNFFISQFVGILNYLGLNAHYPTLSIILPVGISFYTFKTVSYTFDIYNRKLKPTNSVIDYLLYVSFFPQLLAGPIEKASNLLPQLRDNRTFSYDKAMLGCQLILWGLFKKVVVADNAALIVNTVFSSPDYYQVNPFWLASGIIFFSFQIYCDFSGYSDMAIGSASLLGFDSMTNFKTPYFSRNVAEFWRRWHISLNTWFIDYVYKPMGGSRVSKLFALRNIFAVFLISGLWHGAQWTFVMWGFFCALCYIPLFIFGTNKKYSGFVAENNFLPDFKEIVSMSVTYTLICIGWVFFRSESLTAAMNYIYAFMTGFFSFSLKEFSPLTLAKFLPTKDIPVFLNTILAIIFLLVVEWFGRGKEYAANFNFGAVRHFMFSNAIILMIILFGRFSHQEFIYFQF